VRQDAVTRDRRYGPLMAKRSEGRNHRIRQEMKPLLSLIIIAAVTAALIEAEPEKSSDIPETAKNGTEKADMPKSAGQYYFSTFIR